MTVWRSLGDAITANEKLLEEIITENSMWPGVSIKYCPVPGGISNANWRINVGGPIDYFLKVPGRGTEMFIHRDAANDASRKAAECGFGVEVVDYLPDLGVEVFAFVTDYRASSNLDFLRPSVRRNAITALRNFNDSGPLRLTKTIFDMIEEHIDQAHQVKGRLPNDQDFLMRCFDEAKSAFAASGIELVPCMNDTLAGNFLLNADDRVMLVDFEYASNNERTFEIANWFCEMAFPRRIEQEAIEEYFGRWDHRIDARIKVCRALSDLKWATWAMIQEAMSTLNFDYYKYGTWKYMRARTQFHHPDWSLWIGQV